MNSSWVFRTFWAILTPFIDPRTKNKVSILKDEAELLDHFHPHELPEDFAHVAPSEKSEKGTA